MEVIATALYCKHWIYHPGREERAALAKRLTFTLDLHVHWNSGLSDPSYYLAKRKQLQL